MNTQQTLTLAGARNAVVRGPVSARLNLDGREYINFAGSTYLALGHEPRLRQAALQAIDDGVAFSRQLPAAYGFLDQAIRDVELAAATYCGTEDAVYMASGYSSGAAALTKVDIAESMLFIDEGAHYSLFDASRLSGRPVVPFSHCDPESLADHIRQVLPARARPIVVTDGAFGTTGRIPPLHQYGEVIARYDGHLVVDEAHSFGVLGKHGRGAADYHNVESIATAAATLSKAFCAQGAILWCDHDAAERISRLPPLRGMNAGSPVSAAVSSASIRYMLAHAERRTRLADLTGYLRRRLKSVGIDVSDSPAPIVAFQIGDRAVMESIQGQLFSSGIYILLSNYLGAGPEGILRCAIFADHTEEDIDLLVDYLVKL